MKVPCYYQRTQLLCRNADEYYVTFLSHTSFCTVLLLKQAFSYWESSFFVSTLIQIYWNKLDSAIRWNTLWLLNEFCRNVGEGHPVWHYILISFFMQVTCVWSCLRSTNKPSCWVYLKSHWNRKQYYDLERVGGNKELFLSWFGTWIHICVVV